VEFKNCRKYVLVYMYFQNLGLIWLATMKGYIHSKNNFWFFFFRIKIIPLWFMILLNIFTFCYIFLLVISNCICNFLIKNLRTSIVTHLYMSLWLKLCVHFYASFIRLTDYPHGCAGGLQIRATQVHLTQSQLLSSNNHCLISKKMCHKCDLFSN
jgi:hypothetical protein